MIERVSTLMRMTWGSPEQQKDITFTGWDEAELRLQINYYIHKWGIRTAHIVKLQEDTHEES